MAFLCEKVALITGASRGVGYAAAKKLYEQLPGSVFYLTTKHQKITPELNQTLRKDFGDAGSSCSYIHLDVTDRDNVLETVNMIKERHKTLDIVLNNAGIYSTPIREDKQMFAKQAEDIINTNYFGLKSLMNAINPILTSEGEGSRVVNMSSHLGHLSLINGDERMAQALRKELTDEDITEKRLDELINTFITEAKAGKWSAGGWPGCGYTVSKVAVNVYTRILQKRFDAEGRKVIVNSIHPGTPHSKIHQTSVRSLDAGAEDVAKCASLPLTGPKGEILWSNLQPINWQKAAAKPSLIRSMN